jgi:DNA-binding GntR family transcriptional regulator
MTKPSEGASGRTKIAYDYVKEQLLDGAYAPGDKLPIGSFVAKLGMSRQPVLTAFRQLAVEKLIDIVPQVGCLAVRPSPTDIKDLFHWLAVSEGLMAALAAERGSALDAGRLSQQIVDSEKSFGSRITDTEFARAYRRANRRFHERIHAMATSPLLSESVVKLWDRSDYYKITRLHAMGFESSRNTAHGEHKRIAAAIKRRDCEEARALMEAHIMTSVSDK